MAIPTIRAKFFAVLNHQLQQNGKPTLNPDEFTVGAPTPYTGSQYARNTRIRLDPPLESTNVGRTTIFYNRINMSNIAPINVEKGSATSVIQLLPAINEMMGVEFSANDVMDAVLPASGTFQLTASAGNLLYINAMTMTLII